MRTIDCRGLACPQPVMETKKALEKSEGEEVIVLLDDPASKENVRRFAESQGHRVSVSEGKGVFKLRIERGKGRGEPISPEEKTKGRQSLTSSDFVVFIDSDSLGRGSEELGRNLMRSFLQTLEQSEAQPQKIILINSGVKLACETSEVLEDLQEFSLKGVEILSCGTCLDYFGIKKKLMVGKVSNMYEILNSLTQAWKVIKV
ncbi:MAG: sulfurtransferase-like selenium metabolism protein YedF [Deltaproteobacteria bacterium]|nr:sulfurtransferase-like selenium metabolism protein YedF [Deltaproteobacteria bacterium]